MLDFFEIKKIIDPISFKDKLKTLVAAGEFKNALEKALSVEDDDIVIWLGQLCLKAERYDEAVMMFDSLPSEHPSYSKAQLQAAHAAMFKSRDSLEEDEQSSLKEVFSHLMKSTSEDSQAMRDQYFHKLCGSEDLKPTLTNIESNTETLIAMSEHIRLLSLENKKLKTEVELLRANQPLQEVKSSPPNPLRRIR